MINEYNDCNGQNFCDKVDSLITWWIIKTKQPFNVVESTSFRAIFHALNKRYEPQHRKRIVNLLNEIYQEKKEQVKQLFKDIKWFSVTTDSWKDVQNQRSYVTITVHFIRNYHPGSICIKANEVNAVSLTSEVLKNLISESLEEWGLEDEKMVAIITDGGANFVSAAKDIVQLDIHCVAHRINLVIKDTFSCCPEITEVISKVRNIVTSFKKSSPLMKELICEQQKYENTEPLKLKQDVETRWNSEFIMVKRYIELAVEISNVLRKNSMRNIDLNDDEVSLLSDVVKILEPIYEMTVDLSGDKYITISRVIPILFLVKTSNTRTKINHYKAKRMQTKIIERLESRFKNIEDDSIFAFSTLLDPRFKKIAFNSSSSCANKITELSNILCDVQLSQQVQPEICESSIWSILDKRVNRISNPLSGAANGLKHFVEADALPRDTDPLMFWKNNKNNWPQLHNIFLKYAVVQPTSVPSERVFSKTGLIITEQRNRIKPENVDKICFLESLPFFVY